MNRVADILFDPLFVAILLVVSSIALRRRPRVAPWIAGGAAAVLFVFGLRSVANALVRGLEQPVLTSIRPDVTYDAVIVLGGTMNGDVTGDTGQPAFNESVERVLAAYDLLRQNRARFAILSGTSWHAMGSGEPAESRVIADQLAAWGIDRARLVTDEASTTTHENAIARARGWTRDLLVTSAAHMKRARGCFAHEGLAVDTLAVDFEAYDPAKHAGSWLPRASSLRLSADAIHEYVGRLVYRARGWTD